MDTSNAELSIQAQQDSSLFVKKTQPYVATESWLKYVVCAAAAGAFIAFLMMVFYNS